MKITGKLAALALLAGLIPNFQVASLRAQNTVLTYQGRLLDNGADFNGTGQFKFALVTSTNANHQATAAANPPSGGFITIINVTFGGNGYLSAPAVTISGGGGSGAAAHATLTGGVVTSITVDNPGSGYTGTPAVSVAPPPANISYATYWSNDGTSIAGSEPAGAVNVDVSNGLFTVVLGDTSVANMMAIGVSLFTQPNLQLRIWFNDGVHGSAALDPAQNLTPAPYAVFADTANNLDAGLLIQQNTNGAPNILGGSPNNFISSGVLGATISGGGAIYDSYFFPPSVTNSVTADFGTVGGGAQNNAGGIGATVGGGDFNQATGAESTIAGGNGNTAGGQWSTVAGGRHNVASGLGSTVAGGGGGGLELNGNTASGDWATVGGGHTNTASGPGSFVGGGGYDGTTFAANIASGGASVICGGYGNVATGHISVVSGGTFNVANGEGAIVPGGIFNVANGVFSIAAGIAAHADHDGAFVWSDFTTNGIGAVWGFHSTTNNQFNVRASGGVRFVTAIDLNTGSPTAGVSLAPGGTSWSTISDRNAKKNFRPVNAEAVLDKLAAIPVEQWNYKWESDTSTPNIGPMAQDFKAAFYPGRDDKSITTLEFDGVELAAIQGLNQKLKERDSEIRDLKQRDASLEQKLERLETLVRSISENK